MATGSYFDSNRTKDKIKISIGSDLGNPVCLAVPLIDPTEMSDWESPRRSVAMSTSSCLNSPRF
jgi:hypothetical protein